MASFIVYLIPALYLDVSVLADLVNNPANQTLSGILTTLIIVLLASATPFVMMSSEDNSKTARTKNARRAKG